MVLFKPEHPVASGSGVLWDNCSRCGGARYSTCKLTGRARKRLFPFYASLCPAHFPFKVLLAIAFSKYLGKVTWWENAPITMMMLEQHTSHLFAGKIVVKSRRCPSEHLLRLWQCFPPFLSQAEPFQALLHSRFFSKQGPFMGFFLYTESQRVNQIIVVLYTYIHNHYYNVLSGFSIILQFEGENSALSNMNEYLVKAFEKFK